MMRRSITYLFLSLLSVSASSCHISPQDKFYEAVRLQKACRLEDVEKAEKLLIEAAQGKDPHYAYEATEYLAIRFYAPGHGCEGRSDVQKRHSWAAKMFENPRHKTSIYNPGAMAWAAYETGNDYYEGRGTVKNIEQACVWWEKSYKLGGEANSKLIDSLVSNCASKSPLAKLWIDTQRRQTMQKAERDRIEEVERRERKEYQAPTEYHELKELKRQAQQEAAEAEEVDRRYREAQRANENFGVQALGQILGGVGQVLQSQQQAQDGQIRSSGGLQSPAPGATSALRGEGSFADKPMQNLCSEEAYRASFRRAQAACDPIYDRAEEKLRHSNASDRCRGLPGGKNAECINQVAEHNRAMSRQNQVDRDACFDRTLSDYYARCPRSGPTPATR